MGDVPQVTSIYYTQKVIRHDRQLVFSLDYSILLFSCELHDFQRVVLYKSKSKQRDLMAEKKMMHDIIFFVESVFLLPILRVEC